MTWAEAAAWSSLLTALRIAPGDLALRPERWETRGTVPQVESILKNPLSGPAYSDSLEIKLSSAAGAAELLDAGWEALGVVPAPAAPSPAPALADGLPPALAKPVGDLIAGLEAAHAELGEALTSLAPAEKAKARAAFEAALGDDGFAPARGEDFDAAMRLDLARIAGAGRRAARAVDAAVPALREARTAVPSKFSAKLASSFGPVLVSAGDAEFDAGELAEAGLIVRLGGASRYAGPAAVAGEGRVSVVIDLGGPVTVESDGPAAGSADFGLAYFLALGAGPHAVKAGERSLGAARFGAAYAFVGGDKPLLRAGKFSQGAAAWGAAVLETSGPGAVLKAPYAAQGFGSARGAGLWRHRGDGLAASCGFELSDAREPLGSVSMGQGAGIGPRAFAAGGVGAVHVTGARARLDGSYFAQGAGYWRGLGALYIRGDGARLQARRYSQGTGTHAAVGVLDIKGDRTTTETWGVGPGFGWDYGVGLFRLIGAQARLRSDWASGRSDLGSRAFAWIEGDGGKLALTGMGEGSWTRAQAGYAFAVIKGTGTVAKSSDKTPWGAISTEGSVTFDPALALPDPSWPKRDEGAFARRAAAEAGAAGKLLDARKGESPRERVGRLLFAAAAQILDPKPAEGAARGLSTLTPADAPALAAALDAERFDELTWARLAAAGLGPAAAKAAAAEWPKASGARRAALLDWLRFGRAAEALPSVEAAAQDADWRVRRQAALVLGGLLGDEAGDEPGRRRFLRAAAAGSSAADFGTRRLPDFYSALALAGPVAPETRLALLAAAGTPFDHSAPAAYELFRTEVSTRAALAAALKKEDADAAALLPRARVLLRTLAADPDDEVAAAALWSLGALGGADDAALLVRDLSVPSAMRRDAAAGGLARLGSAAKDALTAAVDGADPVMRAGAALAAAQSSDPAVFALLAAGLRDTDPLVKNAASAALGAAQTSMAAEKKKLSP